MHVRVFFWGATKNNYLVPLYNVMCIHSCENGILEKKNSTHLIKFEFFSEFRARINKISRILFVKETGGGCIVYTGRRDAICYEKRIVSFFFY